MLNLFKAYATTTKNTPGLKDRKTKTLNSKPISPKVFSGKRLNPSHEISNNKAVGLVISNKNQFNSLNSNKNLKSGINKEKPLNLFHSGVRPEGFKHFPPASVEWSNSVYSYNKNYTKTLPILDNLVNKLIKGYFNLKALYNNKKSSAKNIRSNRLSLNRILVSKAEIKHTNNKVIITVYLYNKNKKYFIYKLKELYKTIIFGKPELAIKSLNNGNSTNLSVYPNVAPKKELNNKKFKAGIDLYDSRKNPFFYSIDKYFFYKNINITSRYSTKDLLTLAKVKPSYETKIRLSDFSSKKAELNLGLKALNVAPKTFTLFKNYTTKNNKLSIYNYLMSYKYTANFGFLTNLALKSLSNNVNILTRRNSKYYKLLQKNKRFALTPVLRAQALKWIVTNKKQTGKFSRSVLYNKSGKIRADINKNFSAKRYANKLTTLYNFFLSSKNLSQNNINLSTKTHNLVQVSHLRNNIGLDNNAYFLLNNMHTILAQKKNNRLTTSLKTINSVTLNSLLTHGLNLKFKQFLTKNYLFTKQQIDNLEKKTQNIAKVKVIKNIYKKELLYLYYVKMLYVNNNKLSNWFVLGLKQTISKIYKKKVEFNFVNLKYLHLNSDIFTEAINIKLKNRQNKLLSVLNKALKLVKIPVAFPLKTALLPLKNVNNNKNYNLALASDPHRKGKDILHETIYKLFGSVSVENTTNLALKNYKQKNSYVSVSKGKMDISSLQNKVLNTTPNKSVCGVRLETAGRLSKRLTASRSVFKFKYKGGLKNRDSSNGFSSVMLRGNTKSNIQLTKINSKTRNGSFGLKGWISSY